ncbi:50S ribosomal protein L2 [Candidatus Nomurabacteria bacterium]|nr:50S ribosomal protein L2 [Candidatus Nomurabacteria bacterium]
MKSYRPYTPTRRQASSVTFRGVLTTNEPHKPLTYGRKRAVGRNHFGRITTRHKGGGHKRLFRDIDFKYDKFNIPARIESVEYDPNRSGFIGLTVYADGERRYTLLPNSFKTGDKFLISAEADLKTGNRLPLKKIPVGTFVYNVEIHPGGGAKLVRSAGAFAQVLSNDAGYTNVKLPSSEVRRVHELAWASIGAVSNEEQKLVNLGKAGRSRWLGIRPTVRGSAMNPVDHPYGGGEGRQGRGTRRPKTAHGKVTGGRKTRRPKKYSNVFRASRRQKKGKK